MSDHTNREDFLNAIAEKAGRPRHQLKDHPFEPLNDLPETTLSGHSQDELETIAKRKNSEGVHARLKPPPKLIWRLPWMLTLSKMRLKQ